MKSTLLISTYNWPQALRLVLESAFKQTVLPDEIVICDDGSGEETRTLIEGMSQKSPVPIKHVWHEDRGFRLAMIRNKGVAASEGEYILQIDGDCILSKHFVEDQLKMATRGYYAGGKRIMLNEEWSTKTLTSRKVFVPYFGSLLQHDGLKKFARLHRIPIIMDCYSRLRSRSKRPLSGIYGFSISFWKDDFIKVNGYDEGFTGWGYEDTEMLSRLYNSGLKKLTIHFGGFVYHLYHKTRKEENPHLNSCYLRMKQSIDEKRVWAQDGIDKWL
ncbi:MAG: glycosyltransferase family 2 protein [Porphyromonas sp.]|nr:glycosyltransferase family 2 protein [Bacteroidales bacterium]MDY3100256.1 glycosyltransferase family 2 protein [Porphyromonas sp.]